VEITARRTTFTVQVKVNLESDGLGKVEDGGWLLWHPLLRFYVTPNDDIKRIYGKGMLLGHEKNE
jgi:hypothetical protein